MSNLNLEPKVFEPASISSDARKFNAHLQDIMSKGPKWYEVGAPKYREMRAAGETPLPKATYLDTAENFDIPSRDSGRSIPCRILKPTSGQRVKGVFMHIHGGGWVLQDQKSQDPTLQLLANNTSLLCISIGYRLAPEDPFPAGPNDCYDAAEWLITNSEKSFSAPLSFIGGESAGGHLSMLTALHLLSHPQTQYSSFRFRGLLLHFGCYDMSFTPSAYNFIRTPILVLDRDLMEHYRAVFLPGYDHEALIKPEVSPLYADLEAHRGKLPAALFTVGTEDCLLDDTLFMSSKWMMTGGEAVVKVVPGACHGYIMFPRDMKGSGADVGMEAVESFIEEKMS